MAKLVVLKGEARQVGTKLVAINEECRLPDGLADNLHTQGLCVIVADGVRDTPLVNDVDEHRTDTEALAAKKEATAVKAKVKAGRAKVKKKPSKGGKPVTTADLAGGKHTAHRKGK